MNRPAAVVLLSGGIDSATVLALACRDGFEVHTISFDYGQRHIIELEYASELVKRYRVSQHRVTIDASLFGGGVLTGGERHFGGPTTPPTYVPARNTLFLSHALVFSETIGAADIFIGANKDDGVGYPDCTVSYFQAFERVMVLGTVTGGIRLHTPLVSLHKREVVALARSLDVPLGLTWSCYYPTESARPCGSCDACILRLSAGLLS